MLYICRKSYLTINGVAPHPRAGRPRSGRGARVSEGLGEGAGGRRARAGLRGQQPRRCLTSREPQRVPGGRWPSAPAGAQLAEGRVRRLLVTPLPTGSVSLSLPLPHGQTLRPRPQTSSPCPCPAPSRSSRLAVEGLRQAALRRMAGA